MDWVVNESHKKARLQNVAVWLIVSYMSGHVGCNVRSYCPLCLAYAASLRLLRAPQSVEVAILSGIDVLGVGLELCHRLVARGEIFTQHLVVVGDEAR